MKTVIFDGDTHSIVVVPTANVNSSLFSRFVESIRLNTNPVPTIIAVESAGSEFRFASSMNAGIREAMNLSPKYIVLSNDDITFTKDWLPSLLSSFDCDANLGCAVPNIIVPNGCKIDGITYVRHWLEVLLLKVIHPFLPNNAKQGIISRMADLGNSLRKRLTTELENVLPSSRRGLIVVSQPISVFPTHILSSLNMFDEAFLNGEEDFDLSIRLYSIGLKAAVQLNSLVMHERSVTGGRGWTRPTLHYDSYLNLMRLLEKNKFSQYCKVYYSCKRLTIILRGNEQVTKNIKR